MMNGEDLCNTADLSNLPAKNEVVWIDFNDFLKNYYFRRGVAYYNFALDKT